MATPRRTTFRLYPTRQQEKVLHDWRVHIPERFKQLDCEIRRPETNKRRQQCPNRK